MRIGIKWIWLKGARGQQRFRKVPYNGFAIKGQAAALPGFLTTVEHRA
jgi:hypothetical protein